jgi:hypothetical protein
MLKEGRKSFRVCFPRAFQTERVGRGRLTNGPGSALLRAKREVGRSSGFRRPEVSPPLPRIYKSTANFGQVPFGSQLAVRCLWPEPPHGLRRKDAIN